MRKLLIGLITFLLLALAVYMVVCGISIFGIEISSFSAIQEENAKLENKIEEATDLKNADYPQNVSLLESSYKKLMTEKENYEQILALRVDENGQPLNKIQEYEIEKIWITMGNYATKQGVDLKLDVTSNNSISGTYDLTFTATGGYIQIIDFLYDIESDSTLVFKLENFKMVPGDTTEELVAVFVCKDVKLNITQPSTSTEDATTQESGSTDGNTNSTSSTNSNNSNTTNSTTNTTNTTNTNNTTTNTNSTGNTSSTNNTTNNT